MDLKKAIQEKDMVIQELLERLEGYQKRLSYIEGVTLRVQKVLRRHEKGNLEVLSITNVHNTPDGVIVEVTD